jgi:hypothetical protein
VPPGSYWRLASARAPAQSAGPLRLQVERDAARENTRTARDAFKACKEAFEEKRAIVQPMRDAAATTSEEAKKLRETFRCELCCCVCRLIVWPG